MAIEVSVVLPCWYIIYGKGGCEMEEKNKSKTKSGQTSAETIDKLVSEIAETKDWSVLVPDYDEDALMVHWTSKS